MKRRNRRQQRGFVLLVVLMCILVLLLVSTLLYTRVGEQSVTTVALRNQVIASERARMGAMRAVTELRFNSGSQPIYLGPVPGLTPCTDVLDPAACPRDPAHMVTIPYFNNGTGVDLSAGGGSQYLVQVFREQRLLPFPETVPRVVILATGYYGYDPTELPGAHRTESTVMLELAPAGTGTYECSGYCGGG